MGPRARLGHTVLLDCRANRVRQEHRDHVDSQDLPVWPPWRNSSFQYIRHMMFHRHPPILLLLRPRTQLHILLKPHIRSRALSWIFPPHRPTVHIAPAPQKPTSSWGRWCRLSLERCNSSRDILQCRSRSLAVRHLLCHLDPLRAMA
jgi:hypothetical protein